MPVNTHHIHAGTRTKGTRTNPQAKIPLFKSTAAQSVNGAEGNTVMIRLRPVAMICRKLVAIYCAIVQFGELVCLGSLSGDVAHDFLDVVRRQTSERTGASPPFVRFPYHLIRLSSAVFHGAGLFKRMRMPS